MGGASLRGVHQHCRRSCRGLVAWRMASDNSCDGIDGRHVELASRTLGPSGKRSWCRRHAARVSWWRPNARSWRPAASGRGLVVPRRAQGSAHQPCVRTPPRCPRRHQTQEVCAESTTDGIQRLPRRCGHRSDHAPRRRQSGSSVTTTGTSGNRSRKPLRDLGSPDQTDRGDVVVAETRGDQSAHCASGSVVRGRRRRSQWRSASRLRGAT